ncbi:MAG TPA: acetyltransferase [Chitinophaga sp.]|uniref:acetyltransferase n=1 Tax=Chitinophaga sp. TaxID=1869181 RepID=UPI002BA7E4DA|nr:acetyltransferase [Chitinophaga sp.]HVI44627.1 acetyltransferase [Chitinophaga sp.]
MNDQHKKNIIIIGSAGHAAVIADILLLQHEYHLTGFIDSYKEKGSRCFKDLTVLGNEYDLPALISQHNIHGGIVGIGDNWTRYQVTTRITGILPSFRFINAIHPSSVISPNAILGTGNMISANAVINTGSRIGNGCIINTAACIEHDNTMGDYASIAPNAVTGGNVHTGAFTAINIGAAIIHGITIGEHTVIGAGSLVLKDVSPYSIYYGSPAKWVAARNTGDKYL